MRQDLLKNRYNVTDVSSMSGFADARGSADGSGKDVYFIRLAGRDASYEDELLRMDRILSQRMQAGELKYDRPGSLPRLASVEDAEYYSGCYDSWAAGGRREISIRVTQGSRDLGAALGAACGEVLCLFRQLTPHVNASMEKNFASKLLFWADQAGKRILKDWAYKDSMKVVLMDLSKKQEYLFAYFMTLLGADVLLLQHQSDIDAQLEQLHLSKKAVLGPFARGSLPAYKPAASDAGEPEGTRSAGGMAPQRPQFCVRPAEPALSAGPSSGRVTISRDRLVRPSATGSAPVRGQRRELAFEELAQLASSVVMITVHDAEGQVLGTGSGIMAGEAGYILTNNHVTGGGRFYSVRIEEDDAVYQTDEIIKYNQFLDLAVIRIDRRLKPLPVYGGGKKLVRGQKVVAIGSPLGLFNSVSDGIIAGFRVVNNVEMIQFTAPTSHGSSGGAVLNMYGEVIGISTAGMDSGQNLNLAVSYECISPFIKGFT